MQADTNAIRAFSTTTTDMSAELAAVGAMLSGDPAGTVASAFGPVGARFAAALADATAVLVTRLRNIRDDVAVSAAATAAAARDYDDVEQRARTQIVQVGM